jgi:AcrR family transcriptional regulator
LGRLRRNIQLLRDEKYCGIARSVVLYTMSQKGAATRSRLVSLGLDTLSAEGLAGLTLGRLAADAQISKSGLFAHFRSKEQLQLEILEEATRLADAEVVAPAMQVQQGLPRLRALFAKWLGWSTRAGLRGGCPVAAAIFELDDAESGIVRDRVVELDAKWQSLLRSLVADAIECRHLNRRVDPDQIVWELSGIYLAYHASSRLQRDRQARQRAEVAFSALLRRAGAKTSR